MQSLVISSKQWMTAKDRWVRVTTWFLGGWCRGYKEILRGQWLDLWWFFAHLWMSFWIPFFRGKPNFINHKNWRPVLIGFTSSNTNSTDIPPLFFPHLHRCRTSWAPAALWWHPPRRPRHRWRRWSAPDPTLRRLAETALAGLVGDLNLIPSGKKTWKKTGFWLGGIC